MADMLKLFQATHISIHLYTRPASVGLPILPYAAKLKLRVFFAIPNSALDDEARQEREGGGKSLRQAIGSSSTANAWLEEKNRYDSETIGNHMGDLFRKMFPQSQKDRTKVEYCVLNKEIIESTWMKKTNIEPETRMPFDHVKGKKRKVFGDEEEKEAKKLIKFTELENAEPCEICGDKWVLDRFDYDF